MIKPLYRVTTLSTEGGNVQSTYQEQAIIIQPENREQYFLCRLSHSLIVPGLSREGVTGSAYELRSEPANADDIVAPDWAVEFRFDSLTFESLETVPEPASADSRCSCIVDKRLT